MVSAPLGRFLKRNFEVVAEIGAALRATAPAAAAEEVAEAEHVAQDVGEVPELVEDRWIEAGPAAGGAAHSGVAEAIVRRPLLDIGEDGVGFRRFLELLLGRLVAGVAVRVKLHRELPVSALQLDFGRGAVDREDLVVVAFGHDLATFTIAGRSNRSPLM